MTYSSLLLVNQSVKKTTKVQYLCSIEKLLTAIKRFINNNSDYKVESNNELAKVIHVKYDKRENQNIYLTVIGIDEDKTDLTIEVINDRKNVVMNNRHEQKIDFVINQITEEMNLIE